MKKQEHHHITRVLSVTSGKGGVGKTSTVVNLGIALSRLGRRVLLLDADLGLANIDVMLGLSPHSTLEHVLSGTRELGDVLCAGPDNISILPAAHGTSWMAALTTEQRMTLFQVVEKLAAEYDYLLIDTQAGIGTDVLQFNSAASEIIVVINAEPTSITDAYALIKVLSQNYGEKSFAVLANNVSGEKEARQAFSSLSRSVERFLHVQLKYLGWIPGDSALREALQEQKALLTRFPSSPAGRAYGMLAEKIDSEFCAPRIKGGMQFFFKQLLEAMP